MCESTPFTRNGINYTSPLHCEERVSKLQVPLSVSGEVNLSYLRAWVVLQRLQCGTCPPKVVGRNFIFKTTSSWLFLSSSAHMAVKADCHRLEFSVNAERSESKCANGVDGLRVDPIFSGVLLKVYPNWM